MSTIPLPFQTLYADLVQQVGVAEEDGGTVVACQVGGIRYLRLQRWVGRTRTVQHLGRADDPEVVARAEAARRAMTRRGERRRIVRALRDVVPGPSAKLGQVLDAIAAAGLFRRGAVLVGTAAYGAYPALLGRFLPSASLMTQDADLATLDLTLAADVEGDTMATILRRADPGFTGVPGLDPRRPPSRFRAPDGFMVDLLTAQRRRSDTDPMPLTHLAAGASPLQHLDWLVDQPVRAVLLHGAGVPVRLPQPARFAVHKMIVAQKRPAGDGKRDKDLAQAGALAAILAAAAPQDLEDALLDAKSRGRDGWERPIMRSMRDLRDTLKIELAGF